MRHILWILAVILSVGLMACSKNNEQKSGEKAAGAQKSSAPERKLLTAEEIQAKIAEVKNAPDEPVQDDEVAVIETSMGTIVFQFYPDVAPKHCANFKKLANHGYYDNTLFHRVITGYLIQGGDILSADEDPANDGTGTPGYSLPAEFSNIHHGPGIVSMARKPTGPNTAGSQFFICLTDLPTLDGQYTVFGKVIEGMDVVNRIGSVKTGFKDRPLEDVVVYRVRVVKRDKVM
ncbi:MAG: peptidylprolyl isomerase [candidate division KSB1 bacterium]|nr:peptidylprolyl isomerase [candidate division KSB1 bacterium]